MVRRFQNRRVGMAALAAIIGCLSPLSKVDAQGSNDVAAKKKVEQFLGPDSLGKATIHFVDLNGDGAPEGPRYSQRPTGLWVSRLQRQRPRSARPCRQGHWGFYSV
jgi:hypothetical protein